MSGVRAEMAGALRIVNSALSSLPEEHRPTVPIHGLDEEVDAAFAAGDRERAMRAVEAWYGHYMRQIRKAAVACETAAVPSRTPAPLEA